MSSAGLARCTLFLASCLRHSDRLTVYSLKNIQTLGMTTLQNPGVPRVKLESTIDGNVKSEPIDVEMTSPYADSEDDALEDGGDLDFTNAQQQLWLTQIPRSLWQTCSSIGLDDEIEIGTIRVEGPPENPQRVNIPVAALSQPY